MEQRKRWIGVFVTIALLFAAAMGAFLFPVSAAPPAPPKEIKIAVVLPLSGVLSRNGNLTLQGIKAAIGWVNDNGGIKSLGGAKLVPVVADSGSTVEGAANAMERVTRDPDIVMAIGPWASGLTLASTEVTERAGIPEFSHSYVDTLNQRGFKWGFYVSTPASVMDADMGVGAVLRIIKEKGFSVKTAMVISDNSVTGLSLDQYAVKYLQSQGIKIVGQETWTMGTLTDATPVMQKVKALNPDLVLFNPISIEEQRLCLLKKRELGIKVPFVGLGSSGDPSYLQMGAENLEGYISMGPVFQDKLWPQDWIKRTLAQCKKEYSNEPWVGQELGIGWTEIPIMAAILEQAGTTDRETLRQVAHKLDIHDVMATRAIPGQGMAFDETGRIAKKYQKVLIIQWQGGVPRVVYPPNLATAKPIWLGK